MRELIRKIFNNNNFELIRGFDNIDFYNNRDYTSFYLVYYIDLTNISKHEYIEKLNELENRYIGRDNQVRLKNLLYENIDNDDKKALDKNLSAVYVIKVKDSKEFSDNRNIIYDIEESPYFFKRYILAYTENQVNELVDTLKRNRINLDRISDENLSELVNDFDEYKKLMKNGGEGYYELLVRLFCKLPFLNFTTNNEISIDSLEKEIEGRIGEEGLSIIHNCLINKTIISEDEELKKEKNGDRKSDKEILIERLLTLIDGPKDSDVDEKLREYLGE